MRRDKKYRSVIKAVLSLQCGLVQTIFFPQWIELDVNFIVIMYPMNCPLLDTGRPFP